MESNPGPPTKVTKSTKAGTMVHLNGHNNINGHEENTMEGQNEVRSVLEKQAELINKQKDDIIELRKRLEDNVR